MLGFEYQVIKGFMYKIQKYACTNSFVYLLIITYIYANVAKLFGNALKGRSTFKLKQNVNNYIQINYGKYMI